MLFCLLGPRSQAGLVGSLLTCYGLLALLRVCLGCASFPEVNSVCGGLQRSGGGLCARQHQVRGLTCQGAKEVFEACTMQLIVSLITVFVNKQMMSRGQTAQEVWQ